MKMKEDELVKRCIQKMAMYEDDDESVITFSSSSSTTTSSFESTDYDNYGTDYSLE